MGKRVLESFAKGTESYMTRLIGSMVIKNEKDRYLEDCINHAFTFLDEIFVYDDRSSDGSAELAMDLGCRVVRRPDSRPSFLNHEGKFRYAAWRAFEQVMQPNLADWILSFDADEFPVASQDIRKTLEVAIGRAESSGAVGIVLPFPEIFKIDEQGFWARTDGLWNSIRGPRLFKYDVNGQWSDKSMGCGSEPDYVAKGKTSDQNYGINVLHLGYAKDEDKKAKYERYSSLAQHGHNNSHIESIVKEPKLELWQGITPKVSL